MSFAASSSVPVVEASGPAQSWVLPSVQMGSAGVPSGSWFMAIMAGFVRIEREGEERVGMFVPRIRGDFRRDPGRCFVSVFVWGGVVWGEEREKGGGLTHAEMGHVFSIAHPPVTDF